ncbi:MAG: dihydropteroate synthase [Gammaproteobacteria bacterium]
MFSRQDARPLLMGILNVTPDSFSDGGLYTNTQQAVEHALVMRAEGADIIDIGGESSRPGSMPVPVAEQIRRVVPVIEQLTNLPEEIPLVSVDTTSGEVAAAALEAGAHIINDISAGSDPSLLRAVSNSGAGLVLMHMQGEPATMQDAPSYDDVVGEVQDFLVSRAELAQKAGVPRHRIAIDPGIGFGKKRVHNLELIGGLKSFVETGYAVLLGTSRKRFMGAICEETDPAELVGATCATTAMGVSAGVSVFRVHDVKANRQAADVAWAVRAL